MKPIEGELEKTEEEVEVINKINEYLNKEFIELGIKDRSEIVPEQIHLLPEDVYRKKFPDIDVDAFHDSLNQGICLNKSSHPSRTELYVAILHECIHLASAKNYYYNINRDKIFQYRSGYISFNPREDEHEHFRGLNEMVVDGVRADILKKYGKKFAKEFKFSKQEKKKTFDAYPPLILDVIINKIADKNKEKKDVIWKRFKKGLFTGEMMPLREVERAFGKGALRILASLESGASREVKDEKVYSKILTYIDTDDEKEREKIADEILVERERVRYKKQRK